MAASRAFAESGTVDVSDFDADGFDADLSEAQYDTFCDWRYRTYIEPDHEAWEDIAAFWEGGGETSDEALVHVETLARRDVERNLHWIVRVSPRAAFAFRRAYEEQPLPFTMLAVLLRKLRDLFAARDSLADLNAARSHALTIHDYDPDSYDAGERRWLASRLEHAERIASDLADALECLAESASELVSELRHLLCPLETKQANYPLPWVEHYIGPPKPVVTQLVRSVRPTNGPNAAAFTCAIPCHAWALAA